LRHLGSGASARGGAGYECILPGVSARDIPPLGDAAIPAEFHTIGSLASCLHDAGRVVRICRTSVRAVEAIYGGGERQSTNQIPLGAGFVVREFLGFHLLRHGRERRELVAGTR